MSLLSLSLALVLNFPVLLFQMLLVLSNVSTVQVFLCFATLQLAIP